MPVPTGGYRGSFPAVNDNLRLMQVNSSDSAVWWTGGFEVDADGSPDAYGPPTKPGRDYLANAGHDGNWFGILTDTGRPDGKPVVQGDHDPCPGMYVSTTALVDHSRAAHDPARYVDSDSVPYISIPSDSEHLYGLRVGDVGLVYRNGVWVAAIVADVGPRGKYGEGSIALAHDLGIPDSPKHGGVDAGVTWVVFKNSGRGWPRRIQDIDAQVAALVADAGGIKAFLPKVE